MSDEQKLGRDAFEEMHEHFPVNAFLVEYLGWEFSLTMGLALPKTGRVIQMRTAILSPGSIRYLRDILAQMIDQVDAEEKANDAVEAR